MLILRHQSLAAARVIIKLSFESNYMLTDESSSPPIQIPTVFGAHARIPFYPARLRESFDLIRHHQSVLWAFLRARIQWKYCNITDSEREQFNVESWKRNYNVIMISRETSARLTIELNECKLLSKGIIWNENNNFLVLSFRFGLRHIFHGLPERQHKLLVN